LTVSYGFVEERLIDVQDRTMQRAVVAAQGFSAMSIVELGRCAAARLPRVREIEHQPPGRGM
jgi:hypothetical protein